jgi:hypothetical protein
MINFAYLLLKSSEGCENTFVLVAALPLTRMLRKIMT